MVPVSNQPNPRQRHLPRWLMSIVIALLIFGIGIRFTELDAKFFWIDEVMTTMRSSGHQVKPFYDTWFDNRIIPVQEVQYFQTIQPGGSFRDTITALATEDAKHPPLFFLMVRAWRSVFGRSIISLRVMAALTSLLIFPSIYGFCRALFPQQPQVAKLCLGLTAVSPVYLLYAQEVRAYNIWLATVLLSSAVLQQVTHTPSWSRWALYVALASFGVYNHTMFVIVLFSHGLYALIAGWLNRNNQPSWRGLPALWGQYLAALASILLLFSPWLFQILISLRALSYTTSWVTQPIPKHHVFQQWLLGICSPIFDRGELMLFRIFGPVENVDMNYWPYLLLLLALLGSLIYLFRYAPRNASLQLLCLIGGPLLWLLLPDVVLGGQRSITPRYWLAAYSALIIVLSFLLANSISLVRQRRYPLNAMSPNAMASGKPMPSSRLGAIVGTGLLAAILTLQISSCVQIHQASTWWNKHPYNFPDVAAAVNAVEHPLIISDQTGANPGYLISLSYLLKTGVDLQLVHSPDLPEIPEGYDSVFIFDSYTETQSPLHELYSQQENVSALPVAASALWRLQLGNPS